MRKTALIVVGLIGALVVLGLALSDGDGGADQMLKTAADPAEPGPGVTPPPHIAADDLIQDDSLQSGYDDGLTPATPASTPGPGAPALGVGGAPGGEFVAGGSQLSVPQLLNRKIIRTATLELTVEDVAGAVQTVETAAISAGGFVSGSSLTVENPEPVRSGEEPPLQRQRATVTIRVPAERYPGVISELRRLAVEVKSEQSDASEVTEEYSDLQARIRNLEATEGRYLELLAQAVTVQDILTVQDRLNDVRLQIEQVQGRINLLNDLTDMATVTVHLSLPPVEEEETVMEEEADPGWAKQAWDDAWQNSQDVLQALGTVGITAGVFLMWLLVPGVLLLAAWWLLSGRKRESETTA